MENKPEGGNRPPEQATPRPRMNPSTLWLLLGLAIVAGFLFFRSNSVPRAEINYGLFRTELERGNIAKVEVKGMKILGEFKNPPAVPGGKTDKEGNPQRYPEHFVTTVPPWVLDDPAFDDAIFKRLGDNYQASEPSDNSSYLLGVYLLVTVLLFAGVWLMFRRTRDQVLGGGLLAGFAKSPARRYQAGDKPITFKDVAGLEGVKGELVELVEYLKDPQKFQRLGGRVPKGVLLMGPPGTGKTLLGRAVAGEAGVPFFSISGSEFIQMFVGVGASRVRDLFATAKENAPAILFIDEIDAVGRHRGAGLGGGHDEREQTLNQILSEMDGFTQNDSVIVMAATNRPDVLDPALLRPGRFDRHITVDRPNHKGRLAIFKVHTREVPLADDVDLDRLAAGTVGLTGADIRNLVNEAAIWATRAGKERVEMSDFEYARDKVLMGPKREEILTGKEKSMTAYHEAGHALLVWLVPCSDRVHKISIIPRGIAALGYTMQRPTEDRYLMTKKELMDRLAVLLAGRVAEEIVFGEVSTGAHDDLAKATDIAKSMVKEFGMSETIGHITYEKERKSMFLDMNPDFHSKDYSEETSREIDNEIKRIIETTYDSVKYQLSEKKDLLEMVAKILLEKEVIEGEELRRIVKEYSEQNDQPEYRKEADRSH